MAKTENTFATLGEKLESMKLNGQTKIPIVITLSLAIGLISGLISDDIFIGAGSVTLCAIFLLAFIFRGARNEHFLVGNDKQGFMSDLKLSEKTAIFDGNNLYHFGLENGIGGIALGALVSALRSEGYRIVCFFDANIYYTLRNSGEFKRSNARFSPRILHSIFELQPDEIYVVPKGVQADKYILESLSHLPISFAVTNDRFRDYENEYAFLGKDNQWRKGIQIKARELHLYQHKFKYPLIVK